MIENKKVISRSLIFLFVSLSLVYSLAYMKKTEIFKNVTKTWNEVENRQQTWDTQKENIWSNEENLIDLSSSSVSLQDSLDNRNSTEPESLYSENWVNNSNTRTKNPIKWSNSVDLSSTNIKLLPGTTEFFGTLDIVSILGQKPEYTLEDSKWNYFAYYWDHLDFKDIVETLWGNVYEMVTESEILQNQLFGDRVSYINLSMFKDVRVLMVIKIDGETRLLQIPSNKYHYSKDYLKSLFIH